MVRNKLSRRHVLKTSFTAATTGLLGINTVSASGSDDSISAEEAGIKKRVNELREAGDTLQVLKLLRNYNVDYTATYTSLLSGKQDDAISALSSGQTNSTSSNDVSTQDFFSKSDSYITVYAYNLSGDIHRGQIDFVLEAYDDAFDPDLFGTKDIISLAYSQPNEAIDTTVNHGMSNADDSMLSVRETPVVAGPGAVIDLDDGQTTPYQSTYIGYMSYDIDKDSSDNETLAGKYAHTWSAGNVGSWPSSSYSWSGVGITVDPGYLNNKWTLTGSTRF